MTPKKFKIFLSLLLLLCLTCPFFRQTRAQTDLAEKLKGLILLQVEDRGKAWYVYPEDQKRYYLGKPVDALAVIQELGRGVTNRDLSRIPVALDINYGPDSDQDGVSDRLEQAIGTDPDSQDSDNDGYKDKKEIENNYNPLGEGKISLNPEMSSKVQGYFLIQTEQNGEAWYVYPEDQKRYYLGKPADALEIMKKLSLGVNNTDLARIISSQTNKENSHTDSKKNSNDDPLNNNPSTLSASQALKKAGEKIRRGEISKSLKYFTPKTRKSVEYSLNYLNAEGRFLFANILSGAKFKNYENEKKIYQQEVFFGLGGYETKIKISLEEQQNGDWLISGL